MFGVKSGVLCHSSSVLLRTRGALGSKSCVIIAGASPGETKMRAAVCENFDCLTVVNYTIFAAIIDSFMFN